jgi:hypothetical protein
VQSQGVLPAAFNSFLDLCCNRLVPLNDSKDHKLPEKLRHLVRHLVPSGITYSSSGKSFSRTYLIPKMIVILTGDPLCTAIAKEAFIRELKGTKRGDSERTQYILKQKEILKARKRVSSPLSSVASVNLEPFASMLICVPHGNALR